MVNTKKTEKKKTNIFWTILFFILLAILIWLICSIITGHSNNIYEKHSGLYYSETGIEHCLTRNACLTSTEVYLSNTGLCAIGGTIASDNCHWEPKGNNSISIIYNDDPDDLMSHTNIEIVDNGIIINGKLFTKVR